MEIFQAKQSSSLIRRQKQYEEKDAIARNVVFSDKNKGWIVGLKKKGISSIGHEYLALFTENQGRDWANISDKIKNAADGADSPAGNPKFSRNSVLDITRLSSSSTVLIFLNKARILKTTDDGRTWEALNVSPTTPLFSVFGKFGVREDNSIWILTKREGAEGIAGEIFIQRNNSEFSYNGFGNAVFDDAVYLSQNKFIVAGRAYNQNRKEAIIFLYDNDGKKWKQIYRTAKVSNINALSKISNGNIWAVGDNGIIIHLEMN